MSITEKSEILHSHPPHTHTRSPKKKKPKEKIKLVISERKGLGPPSSYLFRSRKDSLFFLSFFFLLHIAIASYSTSGAPPATSFLLSAPGLLSRFARGKVNNKLLAFHHLPPTRPKSRSYRAHWHCVPEQRKKGRKGFVAHRTVNSVQPEPRDQ